MTRSRAIPVLISSSKGQMALERMQLGAGTFSEQWLQKLIHERPEVLPVSQIEPGFGTVVPIACEVLCGHGYIDNLLLTPTGEIILVETKLWANPQARREVIAQALDYVSALTEMTYDDLQTAAAKAAFGPQTLYSAIAERPDALNEPDFVDAVARNLARGRMLVLVVGDGIRTEAERLGSLLQSHAGAHFTFALVELATWRNPGNTDVLVIPDVLAQTVMIERGVVRLTNGVMQVQPPSFETKPSSLSEEMFYEELAKKYPAMPDAIRDFLNLVEPLGVYANLMAAMNLKADLPEGIRATNFAYITKTGKLWTDALSWTAPTEVALKYNQTLAGLIGGTIVLTPAGSSYVSIGGKAAPRIIDLLPKHAQAWADAISQAIRDIHKIGGTVDA